jgi:hypothetical protein
MAAEGIAEAEPIPSYLIECLVYNVPNEGFLHSSYSEDVGYIMPFLRENTASDHWCNEWLEVNELKYLFHFTQPWTRAAAHAFLTRALTRLGI